jgi:hypothetical protein
MGNCQARFLGEVGVATRPALPDTYEAVLADLKRQRSPVSALYLLGDVVGPRPESEDLVRRIQKPRRGELEPQVCQDWWEEQCLILYGLGRVNEPTSLIQKYGNPMVNTLWKSVPRKTAEWLRSLEFGFFELDCLLIHGSSIGVEDTLTPETPVQILLDRLLRLGANNLFCGRSGLAFQYEIQGGAIASTTQTLDSPAQTQAATITPRQIIGVGNVGREPGQATYTLYNPGTDSVQFQTVHYGNHKGFQILNRTKTVL